MKMYLVPYWLPFPMSEYGGLECVIAENVEQCIQILADDAGEYTRKQYPDFMDLIRAEVVDAKAYELVNSDFEPGIVSSFTT